MSKKNGMVVIWFFLPIHPWLTNSETYALSTSRHDIIADESVNRDQDSNEVDSEMTKIKRMKVSVQLVQGTNFGWIERSSKWRHRKKCSKWNENNGGWLKGNKPEEY